MALARLSPMLIPNAGTSLGDALAAFGAGREVPGSGSANALTAAIAAALTASVAAKTCEHAAEPKYRSISDAAKSIASQARILSEQLLELADQDARVFGSLIAMRRGARTLLEKYQQDLALRSEIGATKPATDIPLKIAGIAIEVADKAILMIERGFAGARGESYSALLIALASAEGAIYVARLNIQAIERKVKTLHDTGYEKPWLRLIKKRATELSARAAACQEREHALRVLYGAEGKTVPRRRRTLKPPSLIPS